MSPTEKDMDCDELFRLTVDGSGRLDELTRARIDEHAKTCEECQSHLEGLAAWDDAVANPGKYPGTKPASDHAAREAKGRQGPNYFPLFFIGAAAATAAFAGYEATGFGLERPGFTPAPFQAPAPAPGTADALTTPAQWLAEANRQLGMSRKEEARKWLEKILAEPSAAKEIRDEARKKLD